jgi:hypothetical protein
MVQTDSHRFPQIFVTPFPHLSDTHRSAIRIRLSKHTEPFRTIPTESDRYLSHTFSHLSDTPRSAIRIRLPNHFRTIADHPTESDTIQSIQAFPSTHTHTRGRFTYKKREFESVLWVFCYMNRLTITHARHDLDIVKTGTFHANRQILPGDIALIVSPSS